MDWFTSGNIQRRASNQAGPALKYPPDNSISGSCHDASEAGLIAVGEPTIEKALDKALTNAGKVVKRTVDATADEITSELQEALKS